MVDRRADGTAYAPGENRAEVQAQLEKLHLHGTFESTALPAQVETERPPVETQTPGVACILETPGIQALLTTLLERVWGVTPAVN